MKQKIIAMGRAKKIALVAHDHKKQDLVDWARFNQRTLSRHQLFSTGTTGRLIEEELGLPVMRLLSGPLGGERGAAAEAGEKIGAAVVNGSEWRFAGIFATAPAEIAER